jgi:hypothetical protein
MCTINSDEHDARNFSMFIKGYWVSRVRERKKETGWGDSLTQRLKDSAHMSELCSQLISETGQDILTIPLCDTEPVLYRL